MIGKKFIFGSRVLDICDFKNYYSENPNNVYEVVRVINSKVLFWDEHFKRLKNSILMFKNLNLNFENLLSKVNLLISENSMQSGNIKIEIIFKNENYELFIYPIEFFYPSSQKGVHVVTYNIERNNPNIKTYDYDFKNKIQKILEDKGVYEVVMVNKFGFITEGSRSNIYFIKGNCFFTAPEKFVLPGVTRLKVNEIIKELGFLLIEDCVSENEIFEFEGCFLTSTSSNVLPIVSINGRGIDSLGNYNLQKLILKFEKQLN